MPSPVAALEGVVDGLVEALGTRVNSFVEISPLASGYERFRQRAPMLAEKVVQTPFGSIRTPELSLPAVERLQFSTKTRDAMKAAIASDLAQIVGVIPVLGDILADVVEDTYGAALRSALSTEEMDRYIHFDKAAPSAIAMLRALSGSKK